ncbi:Uncharacterized protein ChrSV_4834 [Chromobacterium vaccinii]|nr:Uncharacterized protein ChrSW_0440 [Chromobacterium vaccinii]QND82754.1 Uncharacterized protein ChrSW_0525 [Chromobacterium vaccinii]QND83335.1 Uncharacterized protein ChrSW_1108 [Chromobacterium vaccinii]QND83834.1 Uncharacterized protein ChrSW_1607 [Chromobacterium vaccinii]QND84356.1 Uncharacterized protein ChrSW_2129 [Chromobacterium vaccinii]
MILFALYKRPIFNKLKKPNILRRRDEGMQLILHADKSSSWVFDCI